MGTELGGTVTRMGLNVKGNVVAALNKQRREVMACRFSLIESSEGCDLARVPPLRDPAHRNRAWEKAGSLRSG